MMSGNVGGTDGNQVNKTTRRPLNLAKLDSLVGKSIAGSIWAKFDAVEAGGNANNVFDAAEISAIKTYLSTETNLSPEVLAYFESETPEIQEFPETDSKEPQSQQPVQEAPPPTDINETVQTPETAQPTELPQGDEATPEPVSENQVYTAYTVQAGDTFLTIAKRLGLTGQDAQTYADNLKAELQAKGQLDKRGWMRAGQKIQLPGEHSEVLKKSTDYTTDVNVVQRRYSEKSETSKLNAQYPKALLNRAAQIKKDGGKYNLVKNDDGTFSIVQTSGGSYMGKNKISQIELQYDKSGKMLCQKNTYTNGEVRKGVYQNGKMNWTKIAVPIKMANNKTITVPVSVKTRADNMVKAGDKCKIVKQKDGSFAIVQTAGSYMTKNGISKTEILYDKDGNLIGQNNIYKDGHKKLGTMKNGKMSWTQIAAPAPKPKSNIPSSVSEKMAVLKNTNATMVKSLNDGSYTITQTTGTPDGVGSITYKYNSNGDFLYQLNASAADKSVMIGKINKKTGKMEFTQFKDARGILQQIPDKITQKASEMRQDGGQAKIVKGKETFTIVQTVGTYLDKNNLAKIEHKYNPFGVLIEQVLTYKNGRVQKYYDVATRGNDAAHIPNPISIELPAQYQGKDTDSAQMIYGLNTKGPKDTAQRFAGALESNKASLMSSLRLTNEEYDNLAILAMGIAEQETHFGQEEYVNTQNETFTQDGFTDRAFLKKQANKFKWSEEEQAKHSQGITQINYSDAVNTAGVKPLFQAYGINSFKDLISSPEKQAIATMILLKYKKNTAEGPTWQARLKQNNEKIKDPNKRLTTNDVIALLWNGAGGVVKRMNSGEVITIDTEKKETGEHDFKSATNWKNLDFNVYLKGSNYAKNVRTYADRFFASPATQKSGAMHTTNSANTAGALGATGQNNGGFIGEVVFMPQSYSNAWRTSSSHEQRNNAQQFINENTQLSDASKKLLQEYVSSGLIGFGNRGLTREEAISISENDVKLMTEQINAIKLGQITPNQANADFEQKYLRSREFTVKTSSVRNSGNVLHSTRSANPRNSKIAGDFDFQIHAAFYAGGVRRHTAKYMSFDENANSNVFAATRSQGVNPHLANGSVVEDKYRISAEYADYTATELLESGGNCKTGIAVDIECSMGIDHRKIRGVGGRSLPSAKNLTEFYNAHPEVFTPIKFVNNGDGTSRELNATDVHNLPCGYYGVFTPGEGFEKEHGHAFVSDGFGGCFADEHDNGNWTHFGNGKGEHGKLDVYGLSDSVVTVYSEKLGRKVNVPLSINPWYLMPEFRELQTQECQKRGLKVPEYKEEFPV